MKFKKLSLMAGLVTALSLCISICPVPGIFADESDSEAPIFSDDFEGEVISGWSVLGGVGTISLDTDTKQSGNSSLKITGRENAYNGPSISLDSYIDEVETYRFTGWVYQPGTQTETINCTLRVSDSVNIDSWIGIATIEAEPSTWTYFEGTIETPDDISSTLLYFESQNTTMEFSIDNICLYGKAPEPANEIENENKEQKRTSYIFDFESGFGEWGSRGDTQIVRSNEHQLSGNYSLQSINRTKVWNGPTVSIDGIERGVEYTYETNVFYDEKKADDSHIFLLELQYSYNGNAVYETISSAEVNKNEWTKISGAHTVPEGATDVMLYVQTANLEEGVTELTPTDLVSFYIDDTRALRSDMADSTRSKIITLIIIGIGILVILFLIVIIRKVSTSHKDSDDETDTVSDVLEVFDAEHNIKPDQKNEEEKDQEKTESDTTEKDTQKNDTSESKDNSSSDSNKKSDKKKKSENKEKNSDTKKDSSRADEIFNMETFSYEEDSTKYKSDDEDNPLDSPFDGF